MKKQQSGFTLIELVMVIVILGILAAFALPKFADLSGDAERAAIEGALGAVKSASGIAHATYLARGQTNPVSIEGSDFTMVNGYPDGDDISSLANLDGYTVTGTGPFVVTLDGSTCNFTYTEATASAPPAFSAILSCP